MNFSTLFFSSVLAALCSLGLHGVVVAQNNSPCAEGMTQNDPRHPSVICLPELGRMTGFISQCTPGRFEGFGQNVRALSDVNGDKLSDWIVTHNRCDTIINGRTPTEALLYKGVRNGLPDAQDGERLGPTETGSETTVLASGDWNDDGHIDIALRVQVYGDTSFGNKGYDIATLAIFWGNESGRFTLEDTTRLHGGADGWAGPHAALSADLDQDGVADLMTWNWPGQGLTRGEIVAVPKLLIFRGHRQQKWGREGIQRTFDWHWWAPSAIGNLVAIDHDADGIIDVASSVNVNAGTGYVSVLYGASGRLPDTNEMRSVSLSLPNGHSSLFADVTGDRIPELLVHAGSEEQIKVFIGLKGQRIEQQFGTGNDPERPGEQEWWGKPWARISLPKKISSNWPGSDWLSPGDVSGTIDGNLDGIGDVWVYAQPFLLMYNGGAFMDYMVDAMVNELPMNFWRGLTSLGDIDGSRVPTFAFATGNGIIYVKPSAEAPSTGIRIDLPPGTGTASVHDAPNTPHALTLTAIPNPARGEVRVQWDAPATAGEAEITVSDMTGMHITRLKASAVERSAVWNTQDIAAGTYFITVRIADHSHTISVVLQ